jgi:hypothetical protein
MNNIVNRIDKSSKILFGLGGGGVILTAASALIYILAAHMLPLIPSSNSLSSLPQVGTWALRVGLTTSTLTVLFFGILIGKDKIEKKAVKVIYFLALAIFSSAMFTGTAADLVSQFTTSPSMISTSSLVLKCSYYTAAILAGVAALVLGLVMLYRLKGPTHKIINGDGVPTSTGMSKNETKNDKSRSSTSIFESGASISEPTSGSNLNGNG